MTRPGKIAAEAVSSLKEKLGQDAQAAEEVVKDGAETAEAFTIQAGEEVIGGDAAAEISWVVELIDNT